MSPGEVSVIKMADLTPLDEKLAEVLGLAQTQDSTLERRGPERPAARVVAPSPTRPSPRGHHHGALDSHVRFA
jgi:hypothetical protein